MEELRDMLCEELDKITKKGELSAGSLDVIDKLTHSIKSIDTILAMKDAGYSHGYSYAKRDSMGRYSRDYDDSRRYSRGYSRHDAKEELSEELRALKMEAKDHETAQMIERWIKQLEQD